MSFFMTIFYLTFVHIFNCGPFYMYFGVITYFNIQYLNVHSLIWLYLFLFFGEPVISLLSHHVSLVQWTTRLLAITRDPGSNPLGGIYMKPGFFCQCYLLHCITFSSEFSNIVLLYSSESDTPSTSADVVTLFISLLLCLILHSYTCHCIFANFFTCEIYTAISNSQTVLENDGTVFARYPHINTQLSIYYAICFQTRYHAVYHEMFRILAFI